MTLPDGPKTLPILQMMQVILQPTKTLENNWLFRILYAGLAGINEF
jgi:hypothetical protein